MDAEGFEAWMRSRTANPGTIVARVSNLKRVEDAYGDLDAHFQRDRLATVLESLVFSPESEDLRGSSRIKIEGNVYNGLATLRSAVTLYRKFREFQEASPIASAGPQSAAAKAPTLPESIGMLPASLDATAPLRSITLSIDELNTELRRHITQHHGSLTFIEDNGVHKSMQDRAVMLAHDETGAYIAVQVLTRRATRDDAARFVEGMGREEERMGADVRGILAATGFDAGALLLARKVQSLELIQFTLGVEFRSIDPLAGSIERTPEGTRANGA